ncbi:MAG: hypothetical protein KAT61_04065 [Gammaproteobacteria bacterium]|nr:hypothetical protein [Gammaproteobacteria bacterium]
MDAIYCSPLQSMIIVTSIDLNRTETSLLEIFFEPNMHSAKETITYAYKINGMLKF